MDKYKFFFTTTLISLLFACNGLNNDDDNENNINGIEESTDYDYSLENATTITLNENSAQITGSGAEADAYKVKITTQGTYIITGTLTSGQLVVKTDDNEAVKLVLNGVNISNNSTSPLFVDKAVKVILILNEGTTNTFTDGSNYSDVDEGQNAAIYSQSYLSIFGEGNLTVNGNYKDGITGKDGMVIKSGNITVKAADDGIRGKDYLHIYDGNISVVSGGDGLLSDNENINPPGIIYIESGTFNITAGGDGISAAGALTTLAGNFIINSGGGSSKTASTMISTKSVKADAEIVLAGTFNISSAEDGIHSNTDITINSGTYNISAADDGIHATTNVVINTSDITITKSVEGIEGKYLTYNSANLKVISSDDCSNSTAGRRTESNDGSMTTINGGTIILSSTGGDPLDANGNITMTGGTVILHGPKSQPEVAIDYNGTFNLNGGFLIASGTNSNMTQAPSKSSSQNSIGVMFRSALSTSTLFNIQDENGNSLVTFQPERTYYSMIFSSPDLKTGKTYSIYIGGTSTGTSNNGLITGGTYSGGTLKKSLTLSSTVTTASGL